MRRLHSDEKPPAALLALLGHTPYTGSKRKRENTEVAQRCIRLHPTSWAEKATEEE